MAFFEVETYRDEGGRFLAKLVHEIPLPPYPGEPTIVRTLEDAREEQSRIRCLLPQSPTGIPDSAAQAILCRAPAGHLRIVHFGHDEPGWPWVRLDVVGKQAARDYIYDTYPQGLYVYDEHGTQVNVATA
jgi:hypothetical protein